MLLKFTNSYCNNTKPLLFRTAYKKIKVNNINKEFSRTAKLYFNYIPIDRQTIYLKNRIVNIFTAQHLCLPYSSKDLLWTLTTAVLSTALVLLTV